MNVPIENINNYVSEEGEQHYKEIQLLEEHVDILESKLAILNRLDKRNDEGEECSRRYCLRM